MKRATFTANTALHMILLICSIVLLSIALAAATPDQAQAKTRATDVSKASAGNELVNVPGRFTSADKTALLKQINQYRKEACDKRYPNPSGKGKLKPSDYKPIKWSSGLEQIAQTRAAEAALLQSHSRPNGASTFDLNYATQSYGECLAWNFSASISGGVSQWYGEKNDWVKQNSNAVTGHYTAMIDPETTHIGLGGFMPTNSSSWWGAVAGEFGGVYSNVGSEKQTGVKGAYTQVLEVPIKQVSYSLGKASIARGKTKTLKPRATVAFPGTMGDRVVTGVSLRSAAKWSSSNPSVATVSSKGAVTAKKTGYDENNG